VLDHPWFVPACIAVGLFLVANMIVMRMLVDIKV
jgi:tight adherence protein B